MKTVLASLWWLWIFTYSNYVGIDDVMTWPKCHEWAEAYKKAYPNEPPAFCAPAHKPHRDYIPREFYEKKWRQ